MEGTHAVVNQDALALREAVALGEVGEVGGGLPLQSPAFALAWVGDAAVGVLDGGRLWRLFRTGVAASVECDGMILAPFSLGCAGAGVLTALRPTFILGEQRQ